MDELSLISDGVYGCWQRSISFDDFPFLSSSGRDQTRRKVLESSMTHVPLHICFEHLSASMGTYDLALTILADKAT